MTLNIIELTRIKFERVNLSQHCNLVTEHKILPVLPQTGMSKLCPVGRRFLAGPRATCRVLDPKPRHCSVSVVYFCTGDTHNMTRSFESPPIVSCSM